MLSAELVSKADESFFSGSCETDVTSSAKSQPMMSPFSFEGNVALQCEYVQVIDSIGRFS